MNCQNCGAPLESVAGRGHFRCDHCSTIQFLESRAEGSDGIRPLSKTSGLDCPCCENGLVVGEIEGIEVQYCSSCRGFLIGSEEFQFVVQQRKNQENEPSEPITPLDLGELDRRIDCPQCGRRMEVHPYHGRGNSVIDSCHRCSLIWFDHGELSVIRRAASTGPR